MPVSQPTRSMRTLSETWRWLLFFALAFVVILATGGFTEDKSKPRKAGVIYIDSNSVAESSGIAVSTRDNHLLWTHNDSGDRARLFAINRIGKVLAEVWLEQAEAIDWEDMCAFESDGTHWLVVGDCGDNQRKRKEVKLYFAEEPNLGQHTAEIVRTPVKRTVTLTYPGNEAMDCEALAYDPLGKSILLCSKETIRSRIFQVPFPQADGQHQAVAKLVGTMGLPWVTAADISRDGSQMVLATYGPAGYLKRNIGASIASDWEFRDSSKLRIFELPARFQGESVCFDPMGAGIVLSSEGTPMPLYFVQIPNAEPKP